jgi:ABC-type multidrug transport system fused ATPase/permease subunit
MFLLLAIGSFGFNFLETSLSGISSERLNKKVRQTMFKAILTQPIRYFDNPINSIGILTTKLSMDANYVHSM